MGTWGTSIYSCDISEDVRDACNVIFSFYDIEEGNNRLFLAFKDVLNQGFIDNEYASFWYALSDWQWKHGMLTEYVKEIAVRLLNDYAGIDEWIESEDYKDIKKRKIVLDKLKKQLQEPQPSLKKPKKKVSKPKHKPGEIIIFKASNNHGQEPFSQWKIESLSPPILFESTVFSNSQYEDIDGFDARDKYMALLCVGSVQEIYSEYIDGIYDEHSVYVWYDYLSFEQPSLKDLCTCGFLPYIYRDWKDFNRNITQSINWAYGFTLISEKFIQSREIDSIFTLYNYNEVERYKYLFSQKDYSSEYYGGFTIPEMYSTLFEEKNRATLIGEEYDNLLRSELNAPQLLSPIEADSALREFIKKNCSNLC